MSTETVTSSQSKGRYITFPGVISTWLENEFELRGHRHVNEFVIDIVRKAWEREQPNESDEAKTKASID